MRSPAPLLLAVALALGAAACNNNSPTRCVKDADCGRGRSCCDRVCTNVLIDALHCGACGVACPSQNGTAACEAGACKLTCNEGFGNCNNDIRDGCEADTQTSPAHCGGCGGKCQANNAEPLCIGGSCAVGQCLSGYQSCDGVTQNGCEVATFEDTQNCGGCGAVCAPKNATGRCSGGRCQVGSCAQGFGNCNSDAADGCEVNTAFAVEHCGQCGFPCINGQVCSFGQCTAPSIIGFGGTSGQFPVKDVWRFDLKAKTFESLATQTPDGDPGGRSGHLALWDGALGRMVVYGGQGEGPGLPVDTWALDFTTSPPSWVNLTADGLRPPGRTEMAWAHDKVGRRLFVYGGTRAGSSSDGGTSTLSDLWVFDLSTDTWTQLHPSGEPNAPGVVAEAGGFDPVTGQFVLVIPGESSTFTFPPPVVWVYSPSTQSWGKPALGGSIGNLSEVGRFFPGADALYFFGGMELVISFPFSLEHPDALRKLSLSPAAWSEVQASGTRPPGRTHHVATAVGRYLVIFAGRRFDLTGGEFNRDDLWAYDIEAQTWEELVAQGSGLAPATAGASIVGQY
jgi:hypothetical protein